MPKRKLLESINELWNNQYTYFILIGFIVGICTGFSNVIFHFFYNSITDLFLNPLAKKNLVLVTLIAKLSGRITENEGPKGGTRLLKTEKNGESPSFCF